MREETEKRRDARQREVIELDRGYHLVLAPAGCGKTDILAERVLRALCNGVDVEQMLCLTFTNRASRGMLERIRKVAGERAASLFVGNTHRFCSRFLFEHNVVPLSTSIMDEEDMASVIDDLCEAIPNQTVRKDVKSIYEDISGPGHTAIAELQQLMHQYRLGHPREVLLSRVSDQCYHLTREPVFSPAQFATLCRETDHEVSIASLLDIYHNASQYINTPAIRASDRIIKMLYLARLYDAYKQREGLMDFDDLLVETYDYARAHREEIPRYSWIQIDEVQDLNPLQFAIVDLFTAPRHVTIYLGDEQQAIFSFIGARLDTLASLKERCGANLHHLDKCYRSPKYLLDFFNDYARLELGTDPDFLPTPTNMEAADYGDLSLYTSENNNTAVEELPGIIADFPRGRTAVLVNSNRRADHVSAVLTRAGMEHFKISGIDLFSRPVTKTMLAHLSVVANECNYLAWTRILSGFKVMEKAGDARRFVSMLKRAAMTPADFIKYPGSSQMLQFIDRYKSQPLVIFDTETTGLDIFNDDIVQIAATRYENGRPVDTLNILLHSDRPIPPMLGKIQNPLVEEYAKRPHVGRAEGLRRFIEFARGCDLMGHNVMYDYNILISNCQRELPEANIPALFPRVHDTMKLARLVSPSLRSYKLKDLLTVYGVAGENTHLADDDIVATRSVADALFDMGQLLRPVAEELIRMRSAEAEVLRARYGALFLNAGEVLYRRDGEDVAMCREMLAVHDSLVAQTFAPSFDKLDYIVDFIRRTVDLGVEPSLYEQLVNHGNDLNTYREADLCDSAVIRENIFVATVHKAKGLEFDNVIVFGCVDGVYPFFATAADAESSREDARRLYVAITRARRRLCLLSYRNNVGVSSTGYSYCRATSLSPFLRRTLALHPLSNRSE